MNVQLQCNITFHHRIPTISSTYRLLLRQSVLRFYFIFQVPGDCESVNVSFFSPIQHSNGLTIESSPVSYFLITAGSQQLTLVWMVHYLFEQSAFEQTNYTRE